jgi:hypothetical protein
LALAERANAHLGGHDQAVWFARLHAEVANLRAALGWALPERAPDLGVRLAGQLGQRFWGLAGCYREDASWL